MRVFTEEQLKKYDGKDGLAYVAYRGKVYDVSASYHWRKGIHHAIHRAGRDLTEASGRAPHDPAFLNRFPIVGELVS